MGWFNISVPITQTPMAGIAFPIWRPPIVSFHFGIPSSGRLRAFRGTRLNTLTTLTNLSEAKLIEDVGANAIVAQGVEVGGHQGIFDPEQLYSEYSTSLLARILVN